jgi:dihydroneopterin aldolase/D-erythro-7,8-dihydroneopterin triphosphate epimerase
MDRIFIRDLRVTCIIGTLPEERLKRQALRLNVELTVSLVKAGRTDLLTETVDYHALEADIATLARGSRFRLIERMAEEVAALCLARPGVRRAQVTVDKPAAGRFARSMAVQVIRTARRQA